MVLAEASQRTGRDPMPVRLHGALKLLKTQIGGPGQDFTGGNYTGSGFG